MIKIKLKKRDANDPVIITLDNLATAKRNLIVAVGKFLYLDRIVEWLSKKIE